MNTKKERANPDQITEPYRSEQAGNEEIIWLVRDIDNAIIDVDFRTKKEADELVIRSAERGNVIIAEAATDEIVDIVKLVLAKVERKNQKKIAEAVAAEIAEAFSVPFTAGERKIIDRCGISNRYGTKLPDGRVELNLRAFKKEQPVEYCEWMGIVRELCEEICEDRRSGEPFLTPNAVMEEILEEIQEGWLVLTLKKPYTLLHYDDEHGIKSVESASEPTPKPIPITAIAAPRRREVCPKCDSAHIAGDLRDGMSESAAVCRDCNYEWDEVDALL